MNNNSERKALAWRDIQKHGFIVNPFDTSKRTPYVPPARQSKEHNYAATKKQFENQGGYPE